MSPDARELLARIGTALYEPDTLTRQETEALYDTLDALVAEVERLRAERDHFRKAWSAAQVRLDCGTDATEAVREERAAVVAWLRKHWSEVLEQTPQQTAKLIERGEHRKEEER